MDVLDGPYYHQSKTYLGVFGVWSLQSARSQLFSRVISYVVWLTIFVHSLCKAYELRHRFYYLLLCVPSLVLYSRYFIKLTYLIFKGSQFRHLLQLIGQDFRAYADENLDILHRYARQAMRLNKIYAYCMLFVTCTFNVPSFVPDLSNLPPATNTTLTQDLPYSTMHSFVFNMLAVVIIVGFDALMLNCAQHGCALFRIVVRETKYALHRHNGKSTNDLYEEIARIIELHNHAIQFGTILPLLFARSVYLLVIFKSSFVDLVESTYATQQLLVTGFTLAAITISEFEIAMNKPHCKVRFRFIVYGAGELLHVLFHNYPGQRIRDHSLMIYQSCYNSEWCREGVPMECRKLLTLMMLRSQKSCCLTGGGLYILGLENYVTILKASLTYFTFLSSMQ